VVGFFLPGDTAVEFKGRAKRVFYWIAWRASAGDEMEETAKGWLSGHAWLFIHPADSE